MAWFNTSWQYRKKITISGSAGAGTDYQVLLKVGESSGSTGADFHVEGHSALFPSGKDDSGDLRFTDNDEITLLNFWVEKVTGTSPNRVAWCWVKVADDLGTAQDIYCYYGNSAANNVSNGANTFIEFDDFSGTTLDPKWTVTETQPSYSDYLISNSVLQLQSWQPSSGDASISVATGYNYNMNQDWEVIVYDKGTQAPYSAFFAVYFEQVDAYKTGFLGYNVSGDYRRFYYGNTYVNDGTSIWNAWHRMRINKSGNELNWYIDDVRTLSPQYWIPSFNGRLRLDNSKGYQSSGTVYHDIDYIFLKKFKSPEPAFSSAGTEEEPQTEAQLTAAGIVTLEVEVRSTIACITHLETEKSETYAGSSSLEVSSLSALASSVDLEYPGDESALACFVSLEIEKKSTLASLVTLETEKLSAFACSVSLDTVAFSTFASVSQNEETVLSTFASSSQLELTSYQTIAAIAQAEKTTFSTFASSVKLDTENILTLAAFSNLETTALQQFALKASFDSQKLASFANSCNLESYVEKGRFSGFGFPLSPNV